MKQAFPEFFSSVHWDDQQPGLRLVTKLSVTPGLSGAEPAVCLQNSYQLLRSHLFSFLRNRSRIDGGSSHSPFCLQPTTYFVESLTIALNRDSCS